MGGKYGYDELRKVAFFGVEFGNAFGDAAGKSTGIGKAGAFLVVVDEALSLFTLDRAKLKAEYEDMDDADWQGLIGDCRSKFKLADAPDLEAKVEASVEVGFRLLDVIADGVAVWKGAA